MKRLYLHIGQTKTGSTALQSFLHRNRALMREQGWLFPMPPESSALRQQHRFLVEAIGESRGRPEVAAQAWRPFLKRLGEAPEQHIVLSEETLWHIGLEQPEARRRWLPWMAEQLRDFDVQVLAYLRRQDLWLEAWYQQTAKAPVHRAVTSMDFPTFCAHHEHIGSLDYAALVQDWEAAFGRERVRLRVYDRSTLKQGDITQDFCDWVGLSEDPRWVAPASRQERLSPLHAEVSRLFAGIPGSAAHRRDFLAVLQQTPLAPPSAEPVLMTAQAADELLARCHASNVSLAERHGLPHALFAPSTRQGLAPTELHPSSTEVLQLVLRLYMDLADKQVQLRQELQALRQVHPL